MGKSKRRHTAKTGDKKLYQNRGRAIEDPTDRRPEEPLDERVDRYVDDYIRLDAGSGDDDSDDGMQEEAVMDLGIQDEDEDEDSDESSDSEDGSDHEQHGVKARAGDSDEEGPLSLSDSDMDEEDEEIPDVRDWGRKKSAYYHGDTADLEIGQDEEDAFLEEQAAKEVQAARYQDMSEEDFLDEDTDAVKEQDTGTQQEGIVGVRDGSKLPLKDKRKLLNKQHPEMLPLLKFGASVVEDLRNYTAVAATALLDGEPGTAEAVGATRAGQQYLLTKYLAQLSTALNLCVYLLLKSEHAQQFGDQDDETAAGLIQTHPIMARLYKLNAALQAVDQVEDRIDGLREQLSNLVKAAALVESGEVDAEEDEAVSRSSEELDMDAAGLDQRANTEDDSVGGARVSDEDGQSGDDSDDSNDASEDADAMHKNILSEARFGIRPEEVREDSLKGGKRQRRPAPAYSDFNDDGDVNPRSLAGTLNTIEQRVASKKRKAMSGADEIDEMEEESDQLRRGIEMMEAEFGKDFDKEANDKDDDSDGVDPELDDEDDFYNKVSMVSKSRKAERKKRYEVAPKFPRMEAEIDGERGINRQILKNRGLVAHKKKINRNPRVKKREQYRKALIRRKGAVREVRTEEGHKYGGEGTGIKSSVSRSRKLAG